MSALDLRSLEIFRAVAAEQSVSRAAEKLNRVQSNVSTRIRQLEERLGKSLFLRGSRGLTLTADGQLLLPYADRLLQLSQEASEALNEGKLMGSLRIGTMESTAAARLPIVLSRYHALYPDVDIEIETDVARGLVDRLLNHSVEVAFIAEPVRFESLEVVPVFEEELVLVAPQTYPDLARIEHLNGRTLIAFEVGCAYRRYLEDWLLDTEITPGNCISVGSYLTMLACVSAGAGFSVVPRSVLDTVHSRGQFQYYPLPKKFRRIKTMMSWRSGYHSAKLNALKALITEL